MAIYKINDTDSDTSIEFEYKDRGLIQIIMSNPNNDYAGGCITIQEVDFKEVALALLKTNIKTKGDK